MATKSSSHVDWHEQQLSHSLKKGRDQAKLSATKTKKSHQLRSTGRGMEKENLNMGAFDRCDKMGKKHKRTASLTDLRPEDKKKVANLIQELANLGSEKEKIENCLQRERLEFKAGIRDLVTDQKALLSERQGIQAELLSCQQMLNQLQEAVLHRPTSQPKVPELSTHRRDECRRNNESIVSDNHSKMAGFERDSALDAYLSKHNSTQESMDALSELESVTSEAVKNPR